MLIGTNLSHLEFS